MKLPFPPPVLSVHPLHSCKSTSCMMPADWHNTTVSPVAGIPLQLLSPRRYEHHTFISGLTSTSPYPAIFTYWHPELLTWHRFVARCVLMKHAVRWVWLSFIAFFFLSGIEWQWQRAVEKHILVPPCKCYLTISTLSVKSGAPNNMLHLFLMHRYVVVSFLFRYSAS